MSRPTPLAAWRAVLLYTAFDLKNLLSQRSTLLTLLLFPLMPIGAMLIAVPGLLVGSTMIPETHLVVVSPDPALRDRLEAQLGGELTTVEVVDAAPADLGERLAAGELDAAITLAPDFRTSGAATVTPGAGSVPMAVERYQDTLKGVWLRERLATLAGTDPPLVVVDRDGAPLADEPEDTIVPMPTPEAGVDATRLAQQGLGLFVIGMFGTMVGLGVGPALAKSMKVGFNHLLSLGTSPLAIYTSELVSVALVQVAQSSVWWALLCLAAVVAGRALPITLPPLGDVAAGAPIFVLLALLAGLQSVALSLFAARAAEDLPQEVREKGVGFVLVPLFFFGSRWLDLGSPAVLVTLSSLPVVGPLGLWMHHLAGGAGVLPLMGLQVAWAVGALLAGAWVFGLDESPQAHLRRRWRRSRAA